MYDVILVGNANTGKTTLYNTLSGKNEHVGNWHGVTVEEKATVYSYKGENMLEYLQNTYNIQFG